MKSSLPDNAYQGKVYAAPVDVSGWGIFYNKKVFTDLGLTVPKTYQEFLDSSEKIKNAGIIPVTAGFKDGWPISGTWISMASFVYGANANVAKDLFDGKTKMNGPEFQALFTGFEKMVKSGYLSKSVMTTTYDTALQQIGTGKAAMMFNGPWVNSQVADKYQLDLGFFPLPDEKGNNFITTATNASLSLNAEYKDKQRGIDLIDALIDSSTLPGLLQNSAFTGLPNLTIPQNTNGGKEYADALTAYPSAMQMTLWLPPSVHDVLSQIITKIAAGKSFKASDLDAADQAYQRDKGLVNIE
jgi:raffinose/stachyose/melibiose transport system substrate-binding protein